MSGSTLALTAAVVVGLGVLALRVRLPPDPPLRATAKAVTVVDVPALGGGEVELFATRFGRVVLRSLDRHASALHLHRHAHEAWLPLGPAEASFSKSARIVRANVPPSQLLYAPPYAMHLWNHAPEGLIAFVAAPEDEPGFLDAGDARLYEAADAVQLELADAAPWSAMLDKLRRLDVTKTVRLGPFPQDAAIYVAQGRGELRADEVRPIAARQLVTLPAGASILVTAASPLRLLVFEPARTTVSAILQQGTKRYSQDDEELILRDFFRDRRGARFLDVGAGHFQRHSTTFYLEEALGWSGVAIDALAEYADDYRRHRPRTTFINALITDRARGMQSFYRAEAFPEVSSVSRPLAEQQVRELTDGGVVSERRVPTSTLDAVLDKLGVTEIDLLSMDIEEHEPQALAGFDLDRFHPALACIEAHPAVRDALWRYFRQHGYVRQDQYLAWDQSNWYFARGPH